MCSLCLCSCMYAFAACQPAYEYWDAVYTWVHVGGQPRSETLEWICYWLVMYNVIYIDFFLFQAFCYYYCYSWLFVFVVVSSSWPLLPTLSLSLLLHEQMCAAYQQVFAQGIVDRSTTVLDISSYLDDLLRLSTADARLCEKLMTTDEVWEVRRDCTSCRSPCLECLVYEFYIFKWGFIFWWLLGIPLPQLTTGHFRVLFAEVLWYCWEKTPTMGIY